MVIDRKLTHNPKAPHCNVNNELGSTIDSNFLHKVKAVLCISVRVFGNDTEIKDSQKANIDTGNIFTPSGILIEDKPEQFQNILPFS
jgi:hypothetical protein